MAPSHTNPQSDNTAANEIAILFADIGGSTSMYQKAGDSQAHQLIVNSLSNSVLSVRVGFHWGHAIADDGDVYGNAVNIAARVAGLANIDEITVTADVVEQLTVGTTQPQLLGELAVKGIDVPLSIYRIPWRVQAEGAATVVQSNFNAPKRRSTKTHILIEFDGQSLVLNEQLEKCTIGRDLTSTVIATHSAASRLHATIECKQGVYVLQDLSTNGTYVIKNDQPPVYVHRDTLTLDGAGLIATGFMPDENLNDGEDTISFVTQAEGKF